jgi:hypothetical protein
MGDWRVPALPNKRLNRCCGRSATQVNDGGEVKCAPLGAAAQEMGGYRRVWGIGSATNGRVSRQRKTLVLCRDCHVKLHSGHFDANFEMRR